MLNTALFFFLLEGHCHFDTHSLYLSLERRHLGFFFFFQDSVLTLSQITCNESISANHYSKKTLNLFLTLSASVLQREPHGVQTAPTEPAAGWC